MNTNCSTRPAVLVLVGPTACGKTSLLLELFGKGSAAPGPAALSGYDSPKAVVVSADSMQAYRGMDVGTAKPSPEILERLPHRLIDFLEPSQQYSAGDFVRFAERECRGISSTAGLPVVAGGTGFYVRSFVCGMPTAPAADAGLRAAVARDLAERGAAALREELMASDPDAAERIHPADSYRLTRALEIVRGTGRPMRDFAAPERIRDDMDILLLGVDRPREELYERIDRRVDAMFEDGLAQEFLRLYRSGLRSSAPGMKAIGYREFFDLPAELFELPPRQFADRVELAETRERIRQDSRRYAKRQMTYFRALPDIRWIPPSAIALAEAVESFMARR